MCNEYDPMKYILYEGTVQAVAFRQGDAHTNMFSHHFGRAEYDKNKPVISDSIRTQAQPIIDKLNAGEITEDDARKLLDQISF